MTVPFAPPPECAVREDFEDSPALRALLVDAQTVAVPTSAWEHSMERRVAASEKMLHEIHAAVLELRPAAVFVESSTTQRPAARDRPISNSAAAFGSAAQMAASMGPVAIDRGAATSVLRPLRPDAVVQELAGACSDAAAPWPQVAELYATGNVDQMPLPRDTQDLIQSCSSASLPLDARVSDEIRAKIWAGDFIDLSILLKPSLTQDSSSEYALSIIGGVASPTIRVAPAKTKHSQIVSFETWSQAFQMYMSVYLLSPMYVHDATKMLKYIEVIRGLAEQGGNWRSYGEAFRSLRVSRGWNWDSVNWELWFKASQPPVTRRQPGASPFPVKGRTGGPLALASPLTGGSIVQETPVPLPIDARHAEPTTRPSVASKPSHSLVAPVVSQAVQCMPVRPIDLHPVAHPLHGPERSRMPTPVSIVELQQILHGYDKDRQAYLIHGFTYGFRIGCCGVPPRDNTQVGNLKSAGEFSGVIDRKLSK